jgi:hypothetical protein
VEPRQIAEEMSQRMKGPCPWQRVSHAAYGLIRLGLAERRYPGGRTAYAITQSGREMLTGQEPPSPPRLSRTPGPLEHSHGRRRCWICGHQPIVRNDGTFSIHRVTPDSDVRCAGSGQEPRKAAAGIQTRRELREAFADLMPEEVAAEAAEIAHACAENLLTMMWQSQAAGRSPQ